MDTQYPSQLVRESLRETPKAVAKNVEPLAPTAGRRSDRSLQIVRETLRAVRGFARQTYAAWLQRRRVRAAYLALREVDDRGLRDLGLHRSEILSVAAEIAGAAELTRVRALQARRGQISAERRSE